MDIIKRFVDYYANFKVPDKVIVISSADLQQAQDVIDMVLNYQ